MAETPIEENDVERQYNPRAAVGDAEVERYFERGARLSAAARARHRLVADIAYGPSPGQRLDLFPAGPGTPVHVFIHGGYWRGLDKHDYSFVADALVPQGVTVVLLNYDLCPQVEIPEIVAQIRRAMRWVYARAASLGSGEPALAADGAPARGASPAVGPSVSFSGHSAGAHLIAMALAADSGEAVLPAGRVPTVVLISGVYELEPVLSISVNQEIRLRVELIAPMSPMRHPMLARLPAHVVVGADEPSHWVAQSRDYARVCQAAGQRCQFQALAGQNHFSVTTLLETPQGAVTRLLMEAVRRSV